MDQEFQQDVVPPSETSESASSKNEQTSVEVTESTTTPTEQDKPCDEGISSETDAPSEEAEPASESATDAESAPADELTPISEHNHGDVEQAVDDAELDAASLPFVGRWNQLVSKTNWEKGRIIYQWRDALIASDAPATEYSDEAWAQRVGGVTGQHVGRLRRVYQRFGGTYEGYSGLYWSHFQAAIDWDDAEMWLEGAVQSGWSVSQMRNQRWDAMGQLAEDRPSDDDIVAGELDEDFEPAVNESPEASRLDDTSNVQLGPREEGPDFGDTDDLDQSPSTNSDTSVSVYAENVDESTVEFVRPFEDLKDLPEDLTDAFETFKLAIIHHKMNQWEEVSREDVLSSLEALKQLVMAPSEEDA